MRADDDIEERIKEEEKQKQHIAECVGTLSYHRFEEYKHNAVAGMIKFGGSFISHLGLALDCADDVNSVKIMKVWQSQVAEHEMLYRIWKARELSKVDVNAKGCILET
jgi:hypothetical protein